MTSDSGKLEVDLLVAANHPLYHGSSVLSGLVLLANRGSIALQLRRSEVLDSRRALIHMAVRNPEGVSRKLTIDFADSADSFSIPAVEQSNIYFKRSFMKSEVLRLNVPTQYQERIVPFGLNFASLNPRAIVTHLRITSALLFRRLAALRSGNIVPAWREFVQRTQLAYGLPPTSAFESRIHEAHLDAGPGVLLQTRLWPPQPGSRDLEAVNAERVALVQTLRKDLGSQFVGGIVADAFSKRNCPEDLLIRHTNMREYARTVKKAQIGIYVRGLHHSLAFKMAEYLAAGLCIVSEPFQHELPVPLQEGVNYLLFNSHEECLAQCSWLLSHPGEAARMRAANLDYYKRWVEPAAHMWDVLNKGVGTVVT